MKTILKDMVKTYGWGIIFELNWIELNWTGLSPASAITFDGYRLTRESVNQQHQKKIEEMNNKLSTLSDAQRESLEQ